MSIATETDIFHLIGAIVGSLVAIGGFIWALIKYAPMFVNRVRLIHDLQSARAQVVDLEAYIRTFDRVTDMLDALGDRLTSMELRLAISTRYTCDLILHIQEQRPASEMPATPPELNDDVIAELRTRARARLTPSS